MEFCLLNPYKPSVLFVGQRGKSVDPDQMQHLIRVSVNNTTQRPLKLKWTGLIDKNGKFHLADMGK